MNNLLKNIVLLLLIIYIILFGSYIVNKFSILECFTYEPIIYFINLEKSKDRWTKLIKQFDELKIIKYNRFNGIDGATYKLNNIEKKMFKNADFNYNKSKGITGCALSHFYIWKDIIDKNINECIICEDDVVLNKNFMKDLAELNKIKNNYDLVFLYNTIGNNRDNNQNNEIIPYTDSKWYGCGAVSYYINNRAANILVTTALTKGIHRAVDWFIYEQLKNIKIGITKYPLLKLDNTYSVLGLNNKIKNKYI
jgi:GR25 family glycosyltransferase involved in LPS biosynthesis